MIVWLEREVLLALHDAVLATAGGEPGIADYLALEVLRLHQVPRGSFGGDALPAMAAAQAYALIERRPFHAANRATAAAAMETFLALNGLELTVPEEDVAVAIRAVADQDWNGSHLTAWLEANLRPAA